MSPELSFDVEAFILEATSFPNAANDDQVDAASQYLIETYLSGGGVLTGAEFPDPSVRVPSTKPADSARQQTLRGLPPHLRRLAERSLGRGT